MKNVNADKRPVQNSQHSAQFEFMKLSDIRQTRIKFQVTALTVKTVEMVGKTRKDRAAPNKWCHTCPHSSPTSWEIQRSSERPTAPLPSDRRAVPIDINKIRSVSAIIFNLCSHRCQFYRCAREPLAASCARTPGKTQPQLFWGVGWGGMKPIQAHIFSLQKPSHCTIWSFLHTIFNYYSKTRYLYVL